MAEMVFSGIIPLNPRWAKTVGFVCAWQMEKVPISASTNENLFNIIYYLSWVEPSPSISKSTDSFVNNTLFCALAFIHLPNAGL